MPQLFQVLKCHKCSVFQVHQAKKSNKWECKLCGEKQSIKRHYGIGNGKECRMHVQKLNSIRGEIDELKESIELNQSSDEDLQTCTSYKQPKPTENRKSGNDSKWSNFVEDTELIATPETNETMYLGSAEVVLEMPVRKKKKFKPPIATVQALPDSTNYKSIHSVKDYEPRKPLCEPNECRQRKRPIVEIPPTNYDIYFENKQVQASTLNQEASFNTDSSPHPTSYKLGNITNKVQEQRNIQLENHMKINAYVPPKVNKNSKWAEYADEPEVNDTSSEGNSLENILSMPEHCVENKTPNKEVNRPVNGSKNIFELCDDSELDDILQLDL